jgi:hypothetical protein
MGTVDFCVGVEACESFLDSVDQVEQGYVDKSEMSKLLLRCPATNLTVYLAMF